MYLQYIQLRTRPLTLLLHRNLRTTQEGNRTREDDDREDTDVRFVDPGPVPLWPPSSLYSSILHWTPGPVRPLLLHTSTHVQSHPLTDGYYVNFTT